LDAGFVQKFQSDLIELQEQNSQLNYLMRRQLHLLPKAEKEKLHATSLQNIRIRNLISLTSDEEFVDRKKVVDFKLKQKSRVSNRNLLTEESVIKDPVNERISTQESIQIRSFTNRRNPVKRADTSSTISLANQLSVPYIQRFFRD
jgi:hypothetical protein